MSEIPRTLDLTMTSRINMNLIKTLLLNFDLTKVPKESEFSTTQDRDQNKSTISQSFT